MMRRPTVWAGALVPSSLISGVPAKPGCVVPSMSISVEIVGSALAGVIVCNPPAPMLKVMASAPARALASWMAARSVQTAPAVAQTPLPAVASAASPVLLTTNVAASAPPTPAHSIHATTHTRIHMLGSARITARLLSVASDGLGGLPRQEAPARRFAHESIDEALVDSRGRVRRSDRHGSGPTLQNEAGPERGMLGERRRAERRGHHDPAGAEVGNVGELRPPQGPGLTAGRQPLAVEARQQDARGLVRQIPQRRDDRPGACREETRA